MLANTDKETEAQTDRRRKKKGRHFTIKQGEKERHFTDRDIGKETQESVE